MNTERFVALELTQKCIIYDNEVPFSLPEFTYAHTHVSILTNSENALLRF